MRVAIVAQQRTGSTFLARCLDAHSQVWCPSVELLYRPTLRASLLGVFQSAAALNDFYDKGLIRSRFFQMLPNGHPLRDPSMHKTAAPIRGVNIMHNQLLITPRVERYIVRNTDIHIIHLRRENLLKQHVSNMLNKRRIADRRPAHTTTAIPVATIRIDPKQAIYRMRVSKALYRWFDKRLSRHPKIEMVYERMVGTNGLSEAAAEMLCEFLGVPLEPLVTDLVKLNPDDLSQIVINYEELARALDGTEFEQYLD